MPKRTPPKKRPIPSGWAYAFRHTALGLLERLVLFLRQYALFLSFLFFAGLMLWLAWFIPQSVKWHSAVLKYFDENYLFVVVLIISLVTPLFWIVLWKIPQWQVAVVPNIKDRVDLESKSRQTLAQIIGGAVVLVGLYFTAQTLELSRQGQLTDRFTKAIDQLSKDSLAERLGGIYALERIAEDSEKYHWAVMEVLTAFVRKPPQMRGNWLRDWQMLLTTPMALSKERTEKASQEEPRLRADVQAILTVLGQRNTRYERDDKKGLNLGQAQLQRADLTEAKLQNANLAEAQLQNAILLRAKLQKTDLTKAQLQNANLVEAELQGAILSQAQLQGADLGEATGLTKAQISGSCIDANTTLPKYILDSARPAPCPTPTVPAPDLR